MVERFYLPPIFLNKISFVFREGWCPNNLEVHLKKNGQKKKSITNRLVATARSY